MLKLFKELKKIKFENEIESENEVESENEEESENEVKSQLESENEVENEEESENEEFEKEILVIELYNPENIVNKNLEQNFNLYKSIIEFINRDNSITDLFNNSEEVFISLMDEEHGDIVNSKVRGSPRHLCPIWGMLEYSNYLKLLKIKMDFEIKIPKAVWRGSTTGPDEYYSNEKLRKFSRLELINLSNQFPNHLNAKFTSAVQYVLKRTEKFKKYGIEYDLNLLNKNKLKQEDQLKYKYIIVADGNVATYSFFWVLLSGSVPLKQESDHLLYFESEEDCVHETVKPMVHYVPFKKDFSDLIEKIEWLQQNEQKAIEIANNARNYAINYFCNSYFKEQMISCIQKSIKKSK